MTPEMKAALEKARLAVHEEDLLWDATAKLRRGSLIGAMLTPAECTLLLDQISNKSKKKKTPRGRPRADALEIAIYCTFREKEGMPTKEAVAETIRRYGVSRSIVYEARREFLSE
jgi:hypothetical protein